MLPVYGVNALHLVAIGLCAAVLAVEWEPVRLATLIDAVRRRRHERVIIGATCWFLLLALLSTAGRLVAEICAGVTQVCFELLIVFAVVHAVVLRLVVEDEALIVAATLVALVVVHAVELAALVLAVFATTLVVAKRSLLEVLLAIGFDGRVENIVVSAHGVVRGRTGLNHVVFALLLQTILGFAVSLASRKNILALAFQVAVVVLGKQAPGISSTLGLVVLKLAAFLAALLL